ncbi:hypothetical protein J7J59_05555 [Candidatus Aerophobetes bacterium]|nr:hypothetical protein [Candidatus Aerophobetes bacterium]
MITIQKENEFNFNDEVRPKGQKSRKGFFCPFSFLIGRGKLKIRPEGR